MAKRAYDPTPMTCASTNMCGVMSIWCVVAKDAAVHHCESCGLFTDKLPCHDCHPCAECVSRLAQWRAERAANPPIVQDPFAEDADDWMQEELPFGRCA